MAIVVNVNGESINYPQTGDTNWGDEATDFAVQTSSAFAKVGLSTGTTVDLPGTLDVTGNTTLDANLSVGGTTSLTGNVTLTNNLTVNGNTQLGNANSDTIGVTGIVNVDSGTLYVDPANNRVGINKTTPAQALDVVGDVAISANETVGGTLGVTGNSTFSSNLSVDGNTTLGNASGDSLTINGNAVSIPNGLNIDSNTLVVDATNNRVGIGLNNPSTPLEVVADGGAFALKLRGRSLDGISIIQFVNNTGGTEYSRLLAYNDGTLRFSNGSTAINRFQVGADGQLSAVVPGGSTLYNGYLCRAWVNFNGTGTVAIRASGNVTSITDNGTGDYTVNFANAMPDVNYCILGSVAGSNSSSAYNSYIAGVNQASPKSTSSVRISSQQSGTLYDADNISIGIFR